MGSGSGSRLSDIIEWIEDRLEPRTLDDGAVEEPRLSRRERERQYRDLSWVPSQPVSDTMPVNPPRGSASDIHIPSMALSRLYRQALIVVMITCAGIPVVLYAGIFLGLFNEFGGKGILLVRDHPFSDWASFPENIQLLMTIITGSTIALILIVRLGTLLGVFLGLARQHLFSMLIAAFATGCLAVIWGMMARQPLAEMIALSSKEDVFDHLKQHIAFGVSLAIVLLLATICFSYASTLMGRKTGVEILAPSAGAMVGIALYFLNVGIAEFVPWTATLLIGVGVMLAAVAAVTTALHKSGVE